MDTVDGASDAEVAMESSSDPMPGAASVPSGALTASDATVPITEAAEPMGVESEQMREQEEDREERAASGGSGGEEDEEEAVLLLPTASNPIEDTSSGDADGSAAAPLDDADAADAADASATATSVFTKCEDGAGPVATDTAAPAAPPNAPASTAAPAAAPAGELTSEQALELVAQVEELRRKKSSGGFTLFGWKMTWIMRPRSGVGDMCVIDPRSGGKIHSVIGLKRRLGLVASAELPPPPPMPPPPSASGADGLPTGAAAAAAATAARSRRRAGLTEQQVEELLTAVEAMRRRPHDTDEWCHGWRLIYTLRGPGASARGDMTVVDPLDGQKIFSLVGLQRKLAGDEDQYDALMRRARHAVALANGEDPSDLGSGARKRRRQVNALVDGLTEHELSYMRDRPKRERTAVNYAEANSSREGGARLGDLVLACADEHADGLARGLGADKGDCFAGVDAVTLAWGVYHRQRRLAAMAGREKAGADTLPLGHVRMAIAALLRSGKLRRRLASAAHLADKGSVGHTLQMLVLHSLQVESDADAPWTLPPLGADAAAAAADAGEAEAGDAPPEGGGAPAGAASHVWKGVTPSAVPGVGGASLVGRMVDIWWGGDCCFYRARVTGFNAVRRATGYRDAAAGSHVVVYEQSGLRCVEMLEGVGEPLVWRLVPESDDPHAGGGGGGGGVELDEVVLDAATADDDEEEAEGDVDDGEAALAADGSKDEEGDEGEGVPRVTIKCGGCLPVGSVGTAAHAARAKVQKALRRPRQLIGAQIEIYWDGENEWFVADVLDYVATNATHLVEYTQDGEQEYIDLKDESVSWRFTPSADVVPCAGGGGDEAEEPAAKAAVKAEAAEAEDAAEDGGEGEVAAKVEASDGDESAGKSDSDEDGSADAKPMAGRKPAPSAGPATSDEWRAKGARIENLVTLNTIRGQMPVNASEPMGFAAPPGWELHVPPPAPEGGARRRAAPRWVRLGRTRAGRPSVVDTRAELDEVLEEEARARGGTPSLGQLIDGQWQIRRKALDEALEWVLAQLIGAGLVVCLSGEDAGKASSTVFGAANLYVRGEPFPRRAKASKEEEEEEMEPEEELCDFELQRLRNIERNKELLRQLGLA